MDEGGRGIGRRAAVPGGRVRGAILGLGLTALLWAGTAMAAPNWIQIEAKPDLPAAQARIRDWAGSLAGLGGFRMPGGWYAIVIGPFPDPSAAAEQMRALRAEGRIPEDSHVTDRADYRAAFWPTAPEDTPPATADAEALAEARRLDAALTRADRIAIQSALQWRGVYTATVDGAFGPGTRAAIAAWQATQGAAPTGILSAAQHDALVSGFAREQAAQGMARLREDQAGIVIDMPMGLVAFDRYDPPFVRYRALDGSGVEISLISRSGDRETLGALYEVLSARLPGGPRNLDRARFEISGTDPARHGQAQADLSGGAVKGFVVTWPATQDARMGPILAAMRGGFRPLDGVLDPGIGGTLAVPRAALTTGTGRDPAARVRTGIFVDAQGTVLTAAAGLADCAQVTVDGLPARRSEAGQGLALLHPDTPHASVAAVLAGPPAAAAMVAHFPGWDLPLPLVLGPATPGGRAPDGAGPGAPVLSASGAVLGLVVPGSAGRGEVLPAATIRTALAAAGIAAVAPRAGAGLPPGGIAAAARAVSARVACHLPVTP